MAGSWGCRSRRRAACRGRAGRFWPWRACPGQSAASGTRRWARRWRNCRRRGWRGWRRDCRRRRSARPGARSFSCPGVLVLAQMDQGQDLQAGVAGHGAEGFVEVAMACSLLSSAQARPAGARGPGRRGHGGGSELFFGVFGVAGLQIEFAEVEVDVGRAGVAGGEPLEDGDGLGLVIHGEEAVRARRCLTWRSAGWRRSIFS